MNKKAKITSVENVTDKVIKLRFTLTEPTSMEFKAGQFVSVKVGNMIRRSYSVGSATIFSEYVDLYNEITPGGPGSQYFMKAKVGDEAEFLGPLGIFYYKKSKHPLVFIATGTGIVPFYPMIFEALEVERTKRKIFLYFGVRHQEDIFMEELFADLKKRFKNFDYKITLSKPVEEWKGERGYVTDHIEKDYKDMKGMEAYICGGQGMISNTEELLLRKGMNVENIHYEKFY